ncbi:MAG: DUF1922 domain-containing protein [Candidatus Methanomethylicia archaeon]
MSYLVVKCPYCGDVRAVRAGVKSFQCFNCGKRIVFSLGLVLYKVDDKRLVPYVVMKFKEKVFKGC